MEVAANATSFRCSHCNRYGHIIRCERCQGPNLVAAAGKVTPTNWRCEWCQTPASTPTFSRPNQATATAAQLWQSLDHHGLTTDSPVSLLGGFELLHGHGDCPPAHTLCSIVCLEDGILVVAEVGAEGRIHLPYADLLQLETGGRGTIVQDAGMTGWGSSIRGFAQTMAIAAAINHATRKVTNDCYLRISTHNTEMLFSHWRLAPAAVRAGLGRAFTGFMSAQRPTRPPAPPATPASAPKPTPLDELERLTKLHAAGTLTDSEFQRARDIQVHRLTHEN